MSKESTSNREELIDSLRLRLLSFRNHGNVDRVKDATALEETIELLGFTIGYYDATGNLDIEAFNTIVAIFVARIQSAVDDEAREADFYILRSIVQHVAPAVPTELRDMLNIALPEDLNPRYGEALTLLNRAEAGDSAAIEDAISALTRIVEQMRVHDRILPAVLSNLSVAWRLRYQSSNRLEDLMLALEKARASVELGKGRAEIAGHGIHQFNYGAVAWTVYKRTGDEKYAEITVDAYRAARDLFPRDDPRHDQVETELCSMLADRLIHSGDMATFEELVHIARGRLGNSDDAEYRGRLNDLAMTINEAYHRTGDPKYLNESHACLEEALADIPRQHPLRAAMLTNLNSTLRVKYEFTGDSQHLENAIRAGREAIAAGPEGHPNVVMYINGLNALSIALRLRFESTGELASLNESIELGREAVRISPPNLNRWGYLTTLGNAFKLRYDRTQDSTDLNQAVEAQRGAMAELPAGHQEQLLVVANLASALMLIDTPEARDEAIDVLRQMVVQAPADHPHLLLCGSNLCQILAKRYREVGTYGDLIEAISVGRSVVAKFRGHGRYVEALNILGRALIAAYEHGRDPDLSVEAITVLREGARLTTAPPSSRLSCAKRWAEHAAAVGDWPGAAEGYSLAVELFVRLAARHLPRSDMEHHLSSETGLIWDAAACAVRVGDPALAVRLVEQGRGILLSQALDLRSDISELEAQAPELAARFRTLCSAFEELSPGLVPISDVANPSIVGHGADSDRRSALAREWDNTLAEIRAQPHLKDFLRPPDDVTLHAAAGAGPIIVVNISRYGAAAIIVMSDRTIAVPLPDLDIETMRQRLLRFLIASESLNYAVFGSPAPAEIMSTFSWLWDVIAAPVLGALGITGPPSDDGAWPRIWWSPTGLLTLLPLHMAGHHEDGHNSLLDRVICSYAPTLRVLRRAQSEPVTSGSLTAGAIIALPDTPGLAKLPGAAREAQVVTAQLPNATMLTGRKATRRRVLDALSRASWVHFACHAMYDPTAPSSACVYLHDGPLGVAEISQLRLTQAEFAYLGACDTARGSFELVDEALHIASAFQLAGYRHVVAAQWPLFDDIAVDAARAIYERIDLRENLASLADLAVVTHAAIQELRDKYPDRHEHWGALVHIGP